MTTTVVSTLIIATAVMSYLQGNLVSWLGVRFEKHASRVSRLRSSIRRVESHDRKVSATGVGQNDVHHGRIELDSHADTTVLGRNCIVLQYTGRECDVSPYTDEYEVIKSVPIMTGATTWTDQDSGQTAILVFNEALWMGDQLENSLVNQNQLRYYGTTVQDNPFSDSPMYIMSSDGEFMMELEVDGTNMFVHTCTLTPRELEECPHIILSLPQYWDPQSIQFPRSSHSAEEERSRVLSGVYTDVGEQRERPEMDFEVDSENVCYDLGAMAKAMILSIKVSVVQSVNGDDEGTHGRDDNDQGVTSMSSAEARAHDVPAARTFQSKKRHLDVSPEDLSE